MAPVNLLFRFVFSLIGIVLVSGLPVLVKGLLAGELKFGEYAASIQSVLSHIWQVQDFAVFNIRTQRDILLFPTIAEYISYSLQILFLAFAAAVCFAMLFAVGTMLLPQSAREQVKGVLYFLESIPDLLVIMLAQLLIILIYQQTDVLISKIAVVGGDRIYWLPVLCLMLLPAIQLYRLSMLTFQEEERQMYVELARSLGFSKTFIVLVHMFRNAVISVFFQSKKTLWFMLSNLFVLELMFNMPGIMLFMKDNISPEVFLVTIFSFFIPMFFVYSLGEWFFLRRFRGKEVG
jgi:peptide/nickel transport system permease protein